MNISSKDSLSQEIFDETSSSIYTLGRAISSFKTLSNFVEKGANIDIKDKKVLSDFNESLNEIMRPIFGLLQKLHNENTITKSGTKIDPDIEKVHSSIIDLLNSINITESPINGGGSSFGYTIKIERNGKIIGLRGKGYPELSIGTRVKIVGDGVSNKRGSFSVDEEVGIIGFANISTDGHSNDIVEVVSKDGQTGFLKIKDFRVV